MLDTLLHGLNVFLGYLSFYLTRPPNVSDRGWKGILGIQDLTRMRFGSLENEKYSEGKLDFAASREAEFTKIWARDAVFFPVSLKFGKTYFLTANTKSNTRAFRGVSYKSEP